MQLFSKMYISFLAANVYQLHIYSYIEQLGGHAKITWVLGDDSEYDYVIIFNFSISYIHLPLNI